MSRILTRPFARTLVVVALSLASAGIGAARAADIYDEAVAHPGRSAADLKRDAIDHPADVLRLAGLRRGMRVVDVLSGDGYFGELASYVVGPTGHVLLLNNDAFDQWSEHGWKARIADGRLTNTEHRLVNLDQMGLGEGAFDAVLLVKVYHDLYWVATEGPWPVVHPDRVLEQIANALKPGGIVLVVDHSAKPGTGSNDASSLHRIDVEFARRDFLAHGFEVVGTSEVLHVPADARDQVSYKPPMLGKTDRFVIAFRKLPASH
jgi:predicted methyltransferase